MAELGALDALTVGFIGGGNMAGAIGGSLIQQKILKPSNVWVSGKTERTFPFWRELGAHTTLSNLEVVRNCEVIFLAMKPQMLDEVLDQLPTGVPGRLFVSVLVGVTLETLHKKLSYLCRKDLRIVRTMPNTPIIVGEGITVYCSRDASEKDEAIVEKIFSSNGIIEKVPENVVNAVGGLAGSGPAYGYLMIEGLTDGAIKMGVPRALACKFAAQVLVGAGKMVLDTQKHPGQLKDEVCSTGGSTIAGVHALERGGLRASLMNAVEAAVTRSDELTAKFS